MDRIDDKDDDDEGMGRIEYKLYVWEKKIKESDEKGANFECVSEWATVIIIVIIDATSLKGERETAPYYYFFFQDSLNSQLSLFQLFHDKRQ